MNNRSNGGRASRKINFDQKFFNNRTPITAYWSGFLLADGCLEDKIYKNRRYNRLSMSLAEMDKTHLEIFCDHIQYNKSHLYKENKKVGQNKYIVSLYCNGISESLKYWGIVPRKTYNFELPEVNGELLPDFLRGWFDGDGNLNCKNCPRFRITGNKEALQWYANSLVRLGFNEKISFELPKNKIWGRLYIDGKDKVRQILKLINAANDLKLHRKYAVELI